ncbi:unnamed protein product, partial [marine sediment metagenome]
MNYKVGIIYVSMILGIIGLFFSSGTLAQKKPSGPKPFPLPVKILMLDRIREREIKKEVSQFEKRTGIKVVMDLLGFEKLCTKSSIDLAAGTGEYDVIQIHHFDLPQFSRYLFDLSDWIKRDWEIVDVDDIHPVLRQSYMKCQEKWYGVPMDIDSMVLFYRPDILASYGYDVPNTWNQLVD